MSADEKLTWMQEIVRRETSQPASTATITVCSKCDSSNLFHGGGRVKCLECGFVQDVLNRKAEDPTLGYVQETRDFMRDFRRNRGG